MSKVIEATCVGGVVTADSVPVPSAEILSEGVGSSSGVLILDEDNATYVAKTSPDLKSTLTQLSTALQAIASALTSIDLKPVGGTGSAPAPSAAGNIATINTAKAQIDALKEILK